MIMPTVDQLREAIWQAFYHMEFDDFIKDATDGAIDGNDDPTLRRLAEKLHRRLLDVSAA